MNFFTEWNFFNRIEFYERGYKYLFQINNFIWKKKIFTEKNKVFVKIIHIFFLKNIIIFRIVLLHLNNHIWQAPKSTYLYFSIKKNRSNNYWPILDAIETRTNYLFKVNNRNNRVRYEKCSKLTIDTKTTSMIV